MTVKIGDNPTLVSVFLLQNLLEDNTKTINACDVRRKNAFDTIGRRLVIVAKTERMGI